MEFAFALDFKVLKESFQKNFEEVTKDVDNLFEVELDKEELWNLYLDSFPEGTNKVYRTRREYDCACCRHFMRDIGSVVIIKDNKIKTLWDFKVKDYSFQIVIDALNNHVKSKAVANIFKSNLKKIGTDKNTELNKEDMSTTEWNHFYVELPSKYINGFDFTLASVQSKVRSTKDVFKRSLEELTKDAVLTILELIASNTLHRGTEWESQLKLFLAFRNEYARLTTEEEKDNFTWVKSLEVGEVISRIRNTSIGTLLVNVSEGMDLELAVRKYEDIVAGANYKRPKPIFTKGMLEAAQKKIEDLGYTESLARRYAVLEDITINNVLFSNKDSAKAMSGMDGIFDEMKKDIAIDTKKFSKCESITIENFIANVLPSTNEIEVLLENKHASNMTSLIAPKNKDSKTMFKWNNNFCWAYAGNITDSSIKERVKSVGGDVTGVLRCSLQWNDLGQHNKDDLDVHCIEPQGNRIYYGSQRNHSTTGKLDYDIQLPKANEPAVENITWNIKSKMQVGTYKFSVHNYANRGGQDGFAAEIEFDDGQLFSFEYRKPIRNGEFIQVAEVKFDGEKFTLIEKLPSSASSRDIWNLKTNQFVPVSVMMYSPNYWDEQNGIGHKHYMFMLKDCINSESPNGFYNEFLNQELHENRKVMEALGSKMRVEDNDNQLSGLGFSSTKRNELTVKTKGQIQRMMKITF